MEKQNNFSITGRIKSLGHAIDGLKELTNQHYNIWICFIATIVVVCCGLFFSVSTTDWALLTIAVTMVWTAETLNTAIEFLCDAVSSEYHPLIKKTKDIASAAVLLASCGAAVIGLIVFIPYLGF